MSYKTQSKHYQLSEKAISKFYEIINKKSFQIEIKFEFIGHITQKELIKISNIPDNFAFILQKDILVSINEDLMNWFDEETISILIKKEIDKINFNIETGKIKFIKTEPNTFSASLLFEYGIEKISIVNNAERLYEEQNKLDDVSSILPSLFE